VAELIKSAAYLRLCRKCGEHARIVTSSGLASSKFFSKENGRDIIKSAVKAGLVSEAEKMAIEDQVDHCSLPEKCEERDGEVFISIEIDGWRDDDSEKTSATKPPGETLH